MGLSMTIIYCLGSPNTREPCHWTAP